MHARAGSAWYTLCAMRVVNQALGRVIRHRADFGAILLADERFARPDMRNNISYWARSLLSVRPGCASLRSDLQTFFRENEARAPPRRKKAAGAIKAGRAPAATMGSGQVRAPACPSPWRCCLCDGMHVCIPCWHWRGYRYLRGAAGHALAL